MPRISVLMSVYKEPIDWLRQSVESVLLQTFSDFEFIIVSDNPSYTEGNLLLKDYAERDERIVLIFNEENLGLTKSLNKGLAEAKGEFIARMDADDVSLPRRFEKQMTYMSIHPEKDLCHTNYTYIDENGVDKCRSVSSIKTSSQDLLFWHNVIAHPSVLFRRKVLGIRQPLYNEKVRIGQDYELWTFLIVENCTFGFLDEVLLNYRISANQISTGRLDEQHKNTLRIRKKLILSYLKKKEILQEANDIIDLKKLNKNVLTYLESNKSSDSTEISYLLRIQYILYYTLACKDTKYVIYFLMDKKMRQIPLTFKDKIRIVIAPVFGWKYETMKF